jgi:hypothetical protein
MKKYEETNNTISRVDIPKELINSMEKDDLKSFLENNKAVNLNGIFTWVIYFKAFKIFDYLLKNELIQPEIKNNAALSLACHLGLKEVVKKLLKNPKVSPAPKYSHAIIESFNNQHIEITDLLFEYKEVKDALMKDNKRIYEKIKKNKERR